MTFRLSTGTRTTLAQALATAFANGVIEIRSGTQPANADAAPTGTLLGLVTLNSGAFTPGSPTNGLTWAAAAAGVASKSGVWSFNGITDGTAGWFRFRANAVDSGAVSNTLIRFDGAIAVSGAEMSLSNINIVTGAPNTIDTFNVTMPAA